MFYLPGGNGRGQSQIDHRIPYEVAGDHAETSPEDFMLLSPAANRAKSWSCEHCPNGVQVKNPEVCRSCYWAYPENYSHVATEPVRRLDLMWRGDDVAEYDQLREEANASDASVPSFVKALIRRALRYGA